MCYYLYWIDFAGLFNFLRDMGHGNIGHGDKDRDHRDIDHTEYFDSIHTASISEIAAAVVSLMDVINRYERVFDRKMSDVDKMVSKMDSTLTSCRGLLMMYQSSFGDLNRVRKKIRDDVRQVEEVRSWLVKVHYSPALRIDKSTTFYDCSQIFKEYKYNCLGDESCESLVRFNQCLRKLGYTIKRFKHGMCVALEKGERVIGRGE